MRTVPSACFDTTASPARVSWYVVRSMPSTPSCTTRRAPSGSDGSARSCTSNGTGASSVVRPALVWVTVTITPGARGVSSDGSTWSSAANATPRSESNSPTVRAVDVSEPAIPSVTSVTSKGVRNTIVAPDRSRSRRADRDHRHGDRQLTTQRTDRPGGGARRARRTVEVDGHRDGAHHPHGGAVAEAARGRGHDAVTGLDRHARRREQAGDVARPGRAGEGPAVDVEGHPALRRRAQEVRHPGGHDGERDAEDETVQEAVPAVGPAAFDPGALDPGRGGRRRGERRGSGRGIRVGPGGGLRIRCRRGADRRAGERVGSRRLEEAALEPVELAQQERVDRRAERLEELEVEDRDPHVGLGRVDACRRRSHRGDRVTSRGLPHAHVPHARVAPHGNDVAFGARRVAHARRDESHDRRSGSASRWTDASSRAAPYTRHGERAERTDGSFRRSTRPSDAHQHGVTRRAARRASPQVDWLQTQQCARHGP